ncbi:TetR/AcrR family transcriptional regulator [Mycobacterium spongiae]|uniref:TetR family transcriptional regulator n=1 Tax=Mycobacterium spongiae TaxID=886343 RepID=A0A975PVN4_9MYCO|nr:TetR/AcrR family transcriptional regulator [Mycobacterium spongiae]QUR65788.1 TetR family transcriptional regulator [Mycobacterium spongiae]
MSVTSTQLGRPVGANNEQTRQRILTATMRCVAEVGYSQASIREIAKAAGMTSASLYHYFPTKAELLTAAVAEIENIALPRLRAAGARDGDVASRLDAVLDASDQLMREYPYLASFERAIRAESAAFVRKSQPGQADFAVLRDIIADIVDDACRQGALDERIGADGAVNAIYALARGLTEQAAVLPLREYHSALHAAKALLRGSLFSDHHGPLEPADPSE